MANFIVAARLRRAIDALTRAPAASNPPAASPYAFPFTSADWYHARLARESYDRIERVRRWSVTVTPPDHCPRRFTFTGPIESVARRARHIFPDLPCLVLIEPASNPNGGETYDSRLCVSTTTGE
jgi:hypothetical protein